MATEKIFIGIDQDRIELTGKDKEAFIAEREARAQVTALLQAEQEAQRALKVSAYTKLGLTEEEINAIL